MVVLVVVLVLLGVAFLVPVAVARCATFTYTKTTPRTAKTTAGKKIKTYFSPKYFFTVTCFNLLNPKNGRVGGSLKPPGHFQPVLAMKCLVESEFQGQGPPKPPGPPVPPEPPRGFWWYPWSLYSPIKPEAFRTFPAGSGDEISCRIQISGPGSSKTPGNH